MAGTHFVKSSLGLPTMKESTPVPEIRTEPEPHAAEPVAKEHKKAVRARSLWGPGSDLDEPDEPDDEGEPVRRWKLGDRPSGYFNRNGGSD
jgi:hypothetical protein